MPDYTIVVNRPPDHHKGPKEIARIPYGDRVPAGLLIGKDAIITVQDADGNDIVVNSN